MKINKVSYRKCESIKAKIVQVPIICKRFYHRHKTVKILIRPVQKGYGIQYLAAPLGDVCWGKGAGVGKWEESRGGRISLLGVAKFCNTKK